MSKRDSQDCFGFFLAAELIRARDPWTSVGEVELATLRWVHWWNTKRLHEALDYAILQVVETKCYLTQPINTGA